MLRVPLRHGTCSDLCLPPQSSVQKPWLGLKMQYSGTHPVDDLQITPLSGTFCTSSSMATVTNVTVDNSGGTTVKALVTVDPGTPTAVTLPYNIAALDLTIDMSLQDASRHDPTDTWTLNCGGNVTGFAIFSFPIVPTVCSVVVSPFN